MNGKDLTIGALSVSAVVLLSALLIIHALLPQPAWAYAQSTAAGPYVATTSQIDEFQEVLVLIDTRADLMNIYVFDTRNGTIQLAQQFDVGEREQQPQGRR